MKNRIRGIVPVLLACSALPATAIANSSGGGLGGGSSGGGGIHVDPMLVLCGTPVSATTCSDGRYQQCTTYCESSLAPCGIAHTPGECGPILQPLFTSGYARAQAQLASAGQATTKPVILPLPMAQRHGVQAGTLFNALPIAQDALKPNDPGTGASFQDSTMSLQFVTSMYAPRYSMDDEGLASHLTMNSCAEYVWKKWGMLSQFNDSAHVAGTHWDWIVDAVGAPQASEWGYLTLGQRWDGRSMALNGTTINWPTTIPRNVFYSIVPTWLASATDPVQRAVYQAISSLAPQPVITTPANTPGEALDETWAYQQERTMELAGVTAASFADNERRMAAYGPLVQQLQADQAALDSVTQVNCLRNPRACGQVINALKAAVAQDKQAITQALVAEWTYDSRNGCLGYTYPVYGTPQTIPVNGCDWTPHQFAQTFVDLFTPQREAAYAQCIADTGDDWTKLEQPWQIFQDPRMHTPYNHALTRGYNDQSTDEVIPGQSADQIANASSVEQYLWNYENQDAINAQYRTEEVQQAKNFEIETTSLPLQGAPPGTPGQATYIGQQKQDHDSIGGSWFGGGYSYWAGWSITPRVEDPSDPVTTPARYPQDTVPHICALSGDAGASMKVWATVLTQPITILDAALEVTAQPPALHSTTNTQQPGTATLKQAHLTILDNVFNNGQDYLKQSLTDVGLKEGSTWNGSTFDYPITATPVDGGFSTIIPVLFIPVQVGAGLTVHLGTEFKGAALPPVYCDRTNVGFSLSSSVAPTAEVDGKAWVAIDLGIASAGIEGELTIFKGSMPINGSIKLSSTATSDPNQISLVVDTSANLTMTELSGNVDLYAEVLGNKADVSLFSWSGFTQSPQLWGLTKSYPLIAVNYRLNPSLGNVEVGQ